MLKKIKYFIRSTLLPDSLFLLEGDTSSNNIYLTFDDGPHSIVTTKLLDLLDKYDAKATFFVVGNCVENQADILRDTFERNHTIANHSYSHPRFDLLSLKEQVIEIDKANEQIHKVTGQKCSLFRAPQGRWNVKLLWYLFRNKITAIHWSRDSMDFKKTSAEIIINNFKKKPIKSGEIILFHDDNALCIEVLENLIPWWQSQGFNIKALNTVQ